MSDFQTIINRYFFMLFVLLYTICIALLSGCTLVDKGVALETKVIGLDLTVPSTTVTNALMSIKLGYVSTKYLSTPAGTSGSIDNNYKDINIWSLSGTAESNLKLDNNFKPDSGK